MSTAAETKLLKPFSPLAYSLVLQIEFSQNYQLYEIYCHLFIILQYELIGQLIDQSDVNPDKDK